MLKKAPQVSLRQGDRICYASYGDAATPAYRRRRCLHPGGADDYVAKPFKPPELLARVKALLRRTETPGADEALHAGDLIVDPASFSVTRGGKNVTLSTLEFRLLYFLVAHPNQVFSRDQLLDRVWGIDRHVIPRSVDLYIRHLRKKVLLPSGGGVALKTLRDAGYLLEVKKRV